MENEEKSKEEISSQNKSTKGIWIFGIIIGLFIVLIYLFVSYSPGFEYKGITGNIVKEGNIVFYRTSVPVTYQGEVKDYYFYLRNDPRELDSVPFNGEIKLTKNIIFKSPEESGLNCGGYGSIGIALLSDLYNLLDATVWKDNNAECDLLGGSTLIIIEKGDETKIDQFGPSCYTLTVNNCEILKATEKLLVETLVVFKEPSNESSSN